MAGPGSAAPLTFCQAPWTKQMPAEHVCMPCHSCARQLDAISGSNPPQILSLSPSLSHCWLGAATGPTGPGAGPAGGRVGDGAQLHCRGPSFHHLARCGPPLTAAGMQAFAEPRRASDAGSAPRSAVTPTHVRAHVLPAPYGHLSPSCQRKLLPFASPARAEDAIRR